MFAGSQQGVQRLSGVARNGVPSSLPAPRTGVRVAVATPEAPPAAESQSGLKWLPEAARERATHRKANKFEKVKVEKCGSSSWTDVFELSQRLKAGDTKWEELNLDDIDIRMKWAGLFHRGKRTPGKFMMRLKVPNGELTAEQLRFLGEAIRPYGADGCADITTRANIQLRGVTIEDSERVIKGLWGVGLGSFQSGMDSVRNLTGNPIAGIDPHELVDTRPILKEMDRVLFNNGRGREEFANLPRKINVCLSSTRDDFPHTHINDVGIEAVTDPATGAVAYNVVVGGYFSIKRNIVSVPMECSLTEEQIIPFVEAVLKVFRDHGPRGDRQQTRLIWLIEAIGMEKFRELVGEYMGGIKLAPAVHPKHDDVWERRDIVGVHPQKQEGLSWVGAVVPAGRLHAADFDDIAAVAEKYGDGTVRVTCEENVIFPNIPNDRVAEMTADPLFSRFSVTPGNLLRGLVSCTGNQFCGFGLAETKARAVKVVEMLEAQLNVPKLVRIHFTGCPNSCGQAQVGDIGLMGAPAKLDGKGVEGYKIFLGGKIGEGAELAKEFATGIPALESHLVPVLKDLLIKEFGATEKVAAA